MSDGERKAPQRTRLARVFPDHPMQERELEFQFEGFARTLAELAWNPDNGTPFTVVVRGGWGRGKTTLLRRAQWMLEHPEQAASDLPADVRTVETLWFNAWKYPDDDSVLAGLLGAAIDRLRKGGMLEQLRHLVDSYKSETLKALFALAAPERHLKILRELSERQRHLLIYFATPPAVEAARGRRKNGRRDLFDLDSGAWVEIPGGTFWMGAQKEELDAPGYDPEAEGDESPVHRVTVSSFRLARHPVTNAEYALFLEATGKAPPVHWEDGRIPEGKEQHPVVQVSWKDAVTFCKWLSRRVSKDGGEGRVRLPTEAEWEVAARGEEGRKYPWGGDKPSKELANFDDTVGDTTPVRSYPDGATPEGVQDLAGNVWEWCLDLFGNYSDKREKEEVDPTGPKSGASRVLRGGAFYSPPGSLRAAYRRGYPPGFRYGRFGFRVSWSSRRGPG
ncbi:MAG: SUMF1/EgtB/PvdO family nonheme iron enzyme [Acidobacteriota bacterium]